MPKKSVVTQELHDVVCRVNKYLRLFDHQPIRLPERIDEIQMRHIMSATYFIRDVAEKELREVDRAWDLCTEEVWTRMFMLGGFQDHREMQILQERIQALKKRMQKTGLPDLFKAKIVNRWLKGAEHE